MARYIHKNDPDLAWNRIRRKITRDLDTEIYNRREEVLNHLLTGAWEEYAKAIQTGEVIQLEAKYDTLVRAVVEDVVKQVELDDLAA